MSDKKKSLKESPTNLKEAIDWILRLTGKDGLPAEAYNTSPDCLCLLSEVIHDLVRDVEGYLDEEELGVVRGTLRDLQGVEGTRRISGLLEGVSSGLGLFVGWDVGSGDSLTGTGIGSNGGNGTNQKYTSSYQRDGSGQGGTDDNMSWDNIYDSCTGSSGTSGTLETLARILLGAIPLVFSGLSYMAWMAFALNGFSSSGNKKSEPLKHYVMRMGYKWQEWRLVKGGGVHLSGLITLFDGCSLFGGVEVKNGENYATYLEKLRTEAGKKIGQTSDQLPLLKLNTICSGYFRSLHTIDSIRSNTPRLPRTVREILYWLTSLPYCPIYRTLVPKVQEMIRVNGGSEGQVIFYAKDVNGQDKQLDVSPQNCASYLLGGALVAPMVLLCIQDTIECRVGKVTGKSAHKTYKIPDNSDPVSIHDLYANMQFYFSYPLSETQSYYLLQDCLVALYYQLYFLRLQCNWNRQNTKGDGFGWAFCRYGEGVKCDDEGKDGTGCKSWICPVGDKDKHDYGKGKNGQDNQCGNGSGKASPLQAFLTDCLKGFTCDTVTSPGGGYKGNLKKLREDSTANAVKYSECYPGFLDHRNHLPVGQECAVPMGFSGSFRSRVTGGAPAPGGKGGSGVTGNTSDCVGMGIYGALRYYTSDNASESGLYQITRCICSLTRRVPRSTGTLYGFFHGLGHVLFHRKKNGGQIDEEFKKALEEEMLRCPGSSNTKELLEAIDKWRGGGQNSHKKDNCLTLDSIQNCDGKGQKDQTCGKYFQPLTGSLYNSMATQFCETYVSWIVHLTWRLQSGLESLRDEFRNIDCKEAGCKDKGGTKECQCPSSGCTKGTHDSKCCCDNVVFCAGVHGLFYRFGFSYFSPAWLNGSKKRDCKQFHTQINNVIKGELFTNLFAAINDFKYTTRLPFTLVIFSFWSIVLVYLLWSMTVNLDLIHIQSHWKPARSHLVPLQRILADGSRNVKRVCTIGYFQDSGDRLLSQGVSDVYL